MEMDKNLLALKETLDRIKENTLIKLDKKLEEVKEKLKSDKAEICEKLNKEAVDYKGCHIIVRKSYLTLEREDAIVNPANEDLNHEEGAARAIADKGGDVMLTFTSFRLFTEKAENILPIMERLELVTQLLQILEI